MSEDAGTSYFNVLANDSSKAKLYSLDNNNVNQRAGYQPAANYRECCGYCHDGQAAQLMIAW